MDEVVREFLVESNEGLDQLDRDLVALEQTPNDRDLLARIFRCIHTVKGTCGFLGFSKLESVTHVGESLLSLLRDGVRNLTPERTSALLALVDAVRQILGEIETSGEEGDVDYGELIERLTRLQAEDGAVPAAPAAAEPEPAPAAPAAPPVKNMGDQLIEKGLVTADEVKAAADAQRQGDPRHIGEILVEQAHVPPQAIVDVLESQHAEGAKPAAGGVADSTIRVDVGLLDKLMNLVGELVLARNQILQHLTTTADNSLGATSQRLNLITTELQEGVMKTRMQPIGNVWSKFPRIVRDLALSLEKQVRIDMEGKETELDKTIIEAIKDPLTHIVRNSVDHGIESPAKRVAAGKPAEGRLQLRAFHEGGQVNIEITDDGGGIDPEKLKAKAVQKGILTAEQASRMGEREALNLIFAAGFSTAEKITNVSGRGVGMDVVRTNIERIGGTVDVSSVKGQGTTLKIKIPLTLAIIPGLMVTTNGDRFAIPQVSLLELVRLEGREGEAGIEMIYDSPVYRLRGNILPLVLLSHALGFSDRRWPAKLETVNIVVLQADGVTFGLVVDEINDTEEIVVKPLGKQLKGIAAFAGATILGDGRVALILDVNGLAQQAGVATSHKDRPMVTNDAGANGGNERVTLLLFRVGDRRLAVPLSAIARLEEFPRSTIEHSGSRQVVQYREEIMPLVSLETMLGGFGGSAEADGPEMCQVVVYTRDGRSVGLVVDQILDIVEQHLNVERRGRQGILAGSAVIQDKVTDLLDLAAAVEQAGLEWDEPAEALAGGV
ncbi:MAG: chemotaxis protein CheW [Gemmatimonadales bacterium]